MDYFPLLSFAHSVYFRSQKELGWRQGVVRKRIKVRIFFFMYQRNPGDLTG
jgi:hypothetical protein